MRVKRMDFRVSENRLCGNCKKPARNGIDEDPGCRFVVRSSSARSDLCTGGLLRLDRLLGFCVNTGAAVTSPVQAGGWKKITQRR
jgi:hypothetical protein